jgi:pyruvate kinase
MNLNEFRKTKIVATLGPASLNMIQELIETGVNVFRLNFSHGSQEQHAETVKNIRAISQNLDTPVGILADLQGPKIRVGLVKEPGILLQVGQEFIITTVKLLGEGNKVSTSYTPLADEVKPGNRILLDDGLLELEVKKVIDKEIFTEVIVGGTLTSRKGINLPNVDIKSPALTQKDTSDLRFILKLDVDFVALSFVRKPEDIDLVKKIMDEEGRRLAIIAKIEKPEALTYIDEILARSAGLMVARGDLGVEINTEEVPTVQKMLIKKCNEVGKPVIVATQMLDSMIRNPRPTRAEASDVANAVLDGASAVMLSGESASGKYPLISVNTMDKIVRAAEKNFSDSGIKKGYIDYKIETDVEGITYSAVNLADMLKAKLIVCLTDSGNTAKYTARYRPLTPVIAIAGKDNPVCRTLTLTWGVTVLTIDALQHNKECFKQIHDKIRNIASVNDGDLMVISAGLPILKKTSTNMIKVHRIGQDQSMFF